MPEEHPQELSDAEAARYRAAHAAGEEFRTTMDSGGDDDRRAASAQLLQSISQLSPADTLNKIHMPDGAGEHAEQLRQIMLRIPDGWGRWISCDRGWYPLIVELDSALAELDPNYELHQCKEKFGALRFYFATEHRARRAPMDALVDAAEARSAKTCELCGDVGSLHVRGSWLKTVCAECAESGGWRREPEGCSPRRVSRPSPGRARIGVCAY